MRAEPDLGNRETVLELRERVLRWLVDTSDVVPVARDPRMEPALLDQLVGRSRAR